VKETYSLPSPFPFLISKIPHSPNSHYYSAIISDVTPPSQRSKALSSVGIAFAICFCIGPPIGAYFASRPVPSSLDAWGLKLNVYATPAILTLILLLVEFVYLVVALPETRHFAVHKQDSLAKSVKRSDELVTDVPGQALGERLHRLKAAGRLHFLFMCVFSGIEFTLTFLTFDREFSPTGLLK
jgi:MFS family permease